MLLELKWHECGLYGGAAVFFVEYDFLPSLAEQIKVLHGHTSLVKGVTWDPVGKYLATQVVM